MKHCVNILFILLLLITSSCKRQKHLAIPPEERDLLSKQALDPTVPPQLPEQENHLIPLEDPDDESIDEKDEKLPDLEPVPDEEIKKPLKENREYRSKHHHYSCDRDNNKIGLDPSGNLDFEVENTTGRTLYVVCFSYIKKRHFGRWRWDKSSTHVLKPGSRTLIDIDFIPDEQDRKNVFGSLGIFETLEEAEESTIELIQDHQQLDLDQLYKLKDKKVTIEVERYGFKGEFLEYDFVKKKGTDSTIKPELDILVENNTGKTIHVVGFIYQKKAKGSWFGALDEKDDMSLWRFDKTPILTIKNGDQGFVDVDTLLQDRDRLYIRGYLVLFDENELEKAQEATYELTESWRKLHLDRLERLHNKKIVIDIEKYGLHEDFIDYVIKDTQSPFAKAGMIDEHPKEEYSTE